MEDRFTSMEKVQAEHLDIVLDSIAAKASFPSPLKTSGAWSKKRD